MKNLDQIREEKFQLIQKTIPGVEESHYLSGSKIQKIIERVILPDCEIAMLTEDEEKYWKRGIRIDKILDYIINSKSIKYSLQNEIM